MPVKRIGAELEYPIQDGAPLELPAQKSESLHSQANDEINRGAWSVPNGRLDWDGTVGAEFVSDAMEPQDVAGWYREVIRMVEERYGHVHEPTSNLRDGSTAGLHLHMSELSESQARTLAEWSQQAWLQVFACSNVVGGSNRDYTVFRGGRYCQLSSDVRGSRYNAVNHRSGGHYEWRLPEPVTPDHFDSIMQFCELFIEDPERAREYALDVLDDPSAMVTSVARAEAIGIEDSEVDVSDDPVGETASFFEAVRENDVDPTTVLYDRHMYYTFDVNGVFLHNGRAFDNREVLDAETLERVYGSTRNDVLEIAENGGLQTHESECTPLLKEVAKKKSGERQSRIHNEVQ